MSISNYTQDQSDALQEVINIAMGQAANSLARALNHFVELSVPVIREVCAQQLKPVLHDLLGTQLAATLVRHGFFNGLCGEVIVIFPNEHCHELAGLINPRLMPFDVEQQCKVLPEISNLLVGSLLLGIADSLNIRIAHSEPVTLGNYQNLDQALTPRNITWSNALLVEIGFSLESTNFEAHLLLFLTEDSYETLRVLLNEFLSSIERQK